MNEQLAYEADCIEHGERFVCTFKSKVTNKDKLQNIGQQLAQGWGAECIEVTHLRLERGEKMEDLYDADQPSFTIA